jgi:hypothetical protein
MTKHMHPYKTLETEAVWAVLEKAVKDLVANGDIEERTSRDYIVGYLAKKVVDSSLKVAERGPRAAKRSLRNGVSNGIGTHS